VTRQIAQFGGWWIPLSHTFGKDGLTVQKLLGILVLGLAFSLLVGGTIGCNTAAKDKDKDKDKTAADKDAKDKDKTPKDKDKATTDKDKTPKDKVEFKAVTGETVIGKKKDSKDVEIHLTKTVHDKVTLTGKVMDAKGKAFDKITASGEIAKDKDKGTLKVSTPDDMDVPAGVYTVEVTATGVSGKAEVKLKVE